MRDEVRPGDRGGGVSAPPRGFRDILPTEAREVRAICDALMETYGSYGYTPLDPPTVERVGAAQASNGLIQFLDRDGDLVALRGDITTAVARLVAQRYAGAAGALRLSYVAPVFREEPAMAGAEREYDQAGVELIGTAGTLADAEVLALLAESLARAGLRDATIEIGHVGIVRSLFTELPDELRDVILRELRDGDRVGAFRRARDGGMSAAALDRARRVLAIRGREIEEVEGHEAHELREVIQLARELFPGSGRWGIPNLAIMPTLPYYTGVVFEVLHPEVGFPIAAGGRYDLLLAAFGTPRRATGFAINVPRLHRALFASGWRSTAERVVVALAVAPDAALTARVAAALRRAGATVAIGEVAEPAGQRVVAAEIVDERRLRVEGRVLELSQVPRAVAVPVLAAP